MDYSMNEIAEQYLEYKDVLESVEQGDYDVPYTVEQLEMMRAIVRQLDDMGFGLIARKIN